MRVNKPTCCKVASSWSRQFSVMAKMKEIVFKTKKDNFGQPGGKSPVSPAATKD